MFSIVLVCVGNFQEYIMTNIAQLLRLGHTNIYIITDPHLLFNFDPFSDIVKLISTSDLVDPFHYCEKSTLNRDFRDGFWFHASERLFLVNAFMLKYNVENVIHIENDVLLYYNCDEILGKTLYNETQIYIPFDSFERNIASILFIPNIVVFGKVLENYDFAKNDMQNFRILRHNTDLIMNFPIYINVDGRTGEDAFVSDGWEKFDNMIFDAAAMGQFIGGVDPRNIPGNTCGFVNETCVIKYNQEGKFIWKSENGFLKPFFITNTQKELRVFNLHIHSKALSLFCS
jgi:hypothetical protein